MSASRAARGHPIHPLLAHFPMGLLISSSALDGLGLVWPSAGLGRVALVDLALGLATALLAGAAGAIELRRLPSDSPEEALAVRHMSFVLVALCAYGISLGVRLQQSGVAPPLGALLASAAGTILLAIGGWYGAELVYGHGVGTREKRRELSR